MICKCFRGLNDHRWMSLPGLDRVGEADSNGLIDVRNDQFGIKGGGASSLSSLDVLGIK